MLFPRIQIFLKKKIEVLYTKLPTIFAWFPVWRPCQKLVAKSDHRLWLCLENDLNEEWFQGAPNRPQLCICSLFVHYALFTSSIQSFSQTVRQTPLQKLQTVAYDNSEICSHISREVKLWRAWASRAYVWLVLCCDLGNTLRSWVQGVLSHHSTLFWVCHLKY